MPKRYYCIQYPHSVLMWFCYYGRLRIFQDTRLCPNRYRHWAYVYFLYEPFKTNASWTKNNKGYDWISSRVYLLPGECLILQKERSFKSFAWKSYYALVWKKYALQGPYCVGAQIIEYDAWRWFVNTVGLPGCPMSILSFMIADDKAYVICPNNAATPIYGDKKYSRKAKAVGG